MSITHCELCRKEAETIASPLTGIDLTSGEESPLHLCSDCTEHIGGAGMSNESKLKELEALQQKMRLLLSVDKLEEHNKLLPKYRELRQNVDYGYRVGQKVEYHKFKRQWETGYILEITPMWQIRFSDIIVPVELVRPIEEEKQMSLF